MRSFWRVFYIELGAGVGLFIALDQYLQKILREMERKERTAAKLILVEIELRARVSALVGGLQGKPVFERPGVIPEGPMPVFIGTGPDAGTVASGAVRPKKPSAEPSLTDLPDTLRAYIALAPVDPKEASRYAELGSDYLAYSRLSGNPDDRLAVKKFINDLRPYGENLVVPRSDLGTFSNPGPVKSENRGPTMRGPRND
jgi:hypothetical protein